MKRTFLTALAIILFSSATLAQDFAELDRSPMDMAYFPNNFAHDRKPADKPVIRVTYSRPAKGGRAIFGQLVPYHKVWRTGANEATEIKIYQDIQFGGKAVKAGTYSLFTIPDEQEWDIILSSDLDYWGAYSYNDKDDVIRVKAPSKQVTTPVENFTIQFEKSSATQGMMKLAWDKTVVEIPFTY